MFDNNSKVDCFQYSVSVDRPVEFFCGLIYEMAENFTPKIPLEEVFKDDFLQSAGIRFQKDGAGLLNYSREEVSSFIATYLNNAALEELGKLAGSNILLVNKLQNLLYSFGDENDKPKTARTTLVNFLRDYNIFNKLIDNLKSENVITILTRLQGLRYDEYYGGTITITEKEDILAPYLPFEFLNSELLEADPVDAKDVWINAKKFKKEFDVDIKETNEVYLIRSKSIGDVPSYELGIRYDSVFFPTNTKEVKTFIKPEFLSDFYWLMFKDVYKKGVSRGSIYQDDLLNQFKGDIVDADLSKILSNLINNHYLPSGTLIAGTAFEKYFELVSKINTLKHVDDFEFYVSDVKGKTALGVYSRKKIEKNYNLLHWVATGDPDEKHHYFKNEERPEIKKPINIYALKPVIAFYFISKYFEDLLDKAISEVTKDYIKNFELFINGATVGEIDFLIRTKTKICFIEAKTKLTDEYIEQFIVKCDHLMKSIDTQDLQVEFYIVSAFSDDTCERKKFFIDQATHANYNEPRVGLKSKPYYFKVPIPQHKKLELTCIAEPEFDKLKGIIAEICRS